MNLKEVFYENLRKVSEIAGVDEKLIISKNKEIEVVDARHILIKLMINDGISTTAISRLIGVSPRSIQYAITNFENRMLYSKWARRTYEIIAKQPRNN